MIRDVVAAALPRTSRRWDSRRLYAALVFIPLFYLLVRYLPPIAFFGLVVGASWLALIELYRLHFQPRLARVAIILGLVMTTLVLSHLQWPDALPLHPLLLFIVTATLLCYLLSKHDLSRSLVDVSVLIFGMLYIGFTLGHLLLIRALPDGIFLIFFVILVTWAGDTGAYYAGVSIGRIPLAPRISPSKTVEGLLGGCLLAVVIALLARAWFIPSFTVVDALVLGVMLTVAGLMGDLSESMFKRSAGVKDSGGLIPGHGGMLDRLDSLLLTAPTYYYYVTLVKG
ncbi:MAG: phosphatidate cytidylyltransferase [Nitrospirales bacterium]